jgi:hypothetical protein
VREFAARLATQAPPRDYRAQLRAIYDGILRRWRYVQEPGEWVHSSADSLIRIVLGARYNGREHDPENADLLRLPSVQKGWGDCDDIATVVAACVIAIGMRPYFRVVLTDRGGHVSVVTRTPRGEVVSIDPVGHPEHGFGWIMPAEPNQISYYTTGAELAPSMGCDCSGPHHRGTAFLHLGPRPRIGRRLKSGRLVHAVELPRGVLPPSILTVPPGAMGELTCRDGLTGIDEHGQPWAFSAADGTWQTAPLGSTFWQRVRRRWRKRIDAVVKFTAPIRRIARKVVAKIYGSKIVQGIVGGVLQAFGIPSAAVRGVMQAAASFLEKQGIIEFLRMLRSKSGRKAAMRLVAQAAKKGLIATGLVPEGAKQFLSGMDDEQELSAIERDGQLIPLVPLAAIVELGADASWRVAKSMPDTLAERDNAQLVASIRPQSSRGRSQSPGQADADWLTNVWLWETYPASPTKLDAKNKAHAPYVSTWTRGKKLVVAAMASQPSTKPATSSTPAPFVVSPQEQANANVVAKMRPRTSRGLSQSSGQADADWLTNVWLWETYPASPTKLDAKNKAHAPYVSAWTRGRKLVVAAMASQPKASTPGGVTPTRPPATLPPSRPPVATLPPTRPPATLPPSRPPVATLPPSRPPVATLPPTRPPATLPPSRPPVATLPPSRPPVATLPPASTPQASTGENCWEDEINQASMCRPFVRNMREQDIARAVAVEMPTSEIVGGRVRRQEPGQSPLDFQTNVAYWRAYPDGPLAIPNTAPDYAQAWVRMRNVIASSTPGESLPKQTTPKQTPRPRPRPEIEVLPDPGPNPGPGPGPGPGPSPSSSSSWLPLAVGAAALALLAAKG